MNSSLSNQGELYACIIKDASLSNSESVWIDTSSNKDPNSDVQAVRIEKIQTTFLPNEFYKTFKNLEYLDVLDTNLEEFHPSFFTGARKLKYFWITKSEVRELGADIFTNAGNLEYINLSFNRICFIYKNAFTGLSKLIGLNLENNQVKMIHSKTFSALPSLRSLDLSDIEKTACINKEFDILSFEGEPEFVQAIEFSLKKCQENYVEEVMERGLTAYAETKEILKRMDRFHIKHDGVSIFTVSISIGVSLLICIGFTIFSILYLKYTIKNSIIHLRSRASVESDHPYSYYDYLGKFETPDSHSPILDNPPIQSPADNSSPKNPQPVVVRQNIVDKNLPVIQNETTTRKTFNEVLGKDKNLLGKDAEEKERKSNIF